MAVETLYSTQIPNNQRTANGVVAVRLDDVLLNCDTTTGPVTINLLQIPSGYWNTEYVIYVKDAGGLAATNNITINAPAGFFINGAASFTMAANSETCKVTISSNVDYLCENSATGTPGITSLTIARTAFVAKNGSDSSGLIERLDKPFLTISAALTALIAAQATFYINPAPGLQTSVISTNDRLCVKVFSGSYNETVTLSNFIDLDLTDAVIAPASSLTAMTDNGVSCVATIFGASNILGAIATTGTATALVFFAAMISSQGTPAIFCSKGSILCNVPVIKNNPPDDTAISTILTNGGSVIVNNARIINQVYGYAVFNNAGSIILNNCTLLSNIATYIYSFANAAGKSLLIYGACQANLPAGPNTVQVVSTILVDPNVV